MPSNPTQNKIKNSLIILLISGAVSFLFVNESFAGNKGYIGSPDKLSAQEEKNLSNLQKEARMYRNKGMEMQQAGDLDAAMNFYQKAIVLDPTYAVPYNDLGVIFEAKGFTGRAEESYLRCITIDPDNLAAYTNLALLYENNRDIVKAAYYWEKRATLGSPEDPWTEKAAKRLSDIRLVLSDRPFEAAKEQEIVCLMDEVASQKAATKKSNKALAKEYFSKAKLSYKKGDEVTALKLAIDAAQLDPSNKEIKDFVEKVHLRVLSK